MGLGVLFVGLDGPILVPSPHPDILLKAGIVPYSKPFLFWATSCFKVLWLSQRPPAHAFRVAELLGLPGDAIAYAGFKRSRIEAIARFPNSVWVDGALSPAEIAWVQSSRAAQYVSAPTGVTSKHKAMLERLIAGR